jgi:hypothetical protein
VAQTKLILASPLLIVPPFHHIPVSLETTLEDLNFALSRPGFSIRKVTEPIREDLKIFFIHFSLYLGREIQEHIQNILFLVEANRLIRFIINRTGIQLHQYPRPIFKRAQSSRPSETVVGGSDGLHLLESRESVISNNMATPCP